MKIEGVEIETGSRFVDDDGEETRRYSSRSIEYLIVRVPIPGGKAEYEIILPAGMKGSLEHAVGLIKK